MKKIFILLISAGITLGQINEKYTYTYSSPVTQVSQISRLTLLNQIPLKADTILQEIQSPEIRTKKSPGLAMLISLAVPGMGHLYTKRFDIGKYFLAGEAALWLGYISFTIYGNWLLDDAYEFAVLHAGINKEGKDDEFFRNIGIYDNVEQYNNEMLLYGEYGKLYYPEKGWGFYWDDVNNRKKYREEKLSGDRILNDRLFIGGAIILNHLVSAVSALILTNRYNDEIKKSGSGFSVNADVIRTGSKVHGIKLNLIKQF